MREEPNLPSDGRVRIRIRVTLLPTGKGKPEVVEWEYDGDGQLSGAKVLAKRIAGDGLMTQKGDAISSESAADTTIYPVQRIEKVEVFQDGQE